MHSAGAMRGPAVLTFLSVLALVVFSAGCRVTVEEPHGTSDNGQRTAMSASAAPLPQYDVAISAVDFDPPLKPELLLSPNRPVKLVAAVENKGAMQLSKLVVEASVDSQEGEFSLQDRVSLEKLAPGETRVVQFNKVSTLTAIPRSSSFKVKVSVASPQLDQALPKPSRELLIRVSD